MYVSEPCAECEKLTYTQPRPCPYGEVIHNDDMPVILCDACRTERLADLSAELGRLRPYRQSPAND